jgi:thiol-disulfide isomerase/thioredoxin
MRDFPDVPFLGYDWFWAIFYEKDEIVSQADGIAAMEAYRRFHVEHAMKPALKYIYPPLLPWPDLGAAEFLMRHRWQPERALALLRDGEARFATERKRRRQDDDLTAEQLAGLDWTDFHELQGLATLILDAAKLVGRPGESSSLRASIEGPPPTDKRLESGYWWIRAKLAVLEGRRVDALAYYQLALQKRLEEPQFFRGRLRDELTDETRALWKEMGGSETAWAAWSKPAPGGIYELTEVRWKKAQKQLPPFELTDLSGKMWRLKELAGKSLMINLWATWCGPCNAELPYLQKMYEKVKGRTDIQILTFNIDENLGLVAPFLKEKGYTFPVLPARGFVTSLLGDYGIPQNWIVDPKGTWRWVGGGFDPRDPNWMENSIRMLESVKAGD